jgi:hypothetical protein
MQQAVAEMKFAPDSNLPDMSSDDYREYIAGEGLPSEDVIAARVDAFREREKDMPHRPYFLGNAIYSDTVNGVKMEAVFTVHGYYRKEADGAEYIDSPIMEYAINGDPPESLRGLEKIVRLEKTDCTLEQWVIKWALQNKGVIR